MSLADPRALVPRRWGAVAPALIVVVATWADQALWSALGLVVVATVAVMPRARDRHETFRDTLAWLPIGAAVLFSIVSIAAAIAGRAGLPLWGSGRGAWTWIALDLIVAGTAMLRGGRIAIWSTASLVSWIPAGMLVAAEVFRFSHPMSFWSRPIWVYTDWVNHGEMVVDLFRRGVLDYRLSVPNSAGLPSLYPRGLHAMLASLLDAGTATSSDVQAWPAAITSIAVAVAVLSVLALAGGGLLATLVALRLGAPRWAVVVAPLATGVLLLHPSVFQVLALMGYLTTAAAVVLLFAVVLLAGSGPRERGSAYRLVLVLLLAAGMFQLWQMLVLPVAVIGCYVGWRWWRSGHPRAVTVVGVALMAFLGCLPLAVLTFTSTAVGWTKEGHDFAPFSWWLLTAVCAIPVVALLVARKRTQPLGLVVVLGVASTLLMAVALVFLGGGALDAVPYYAGKVMWHAVVLAMPAAIAVIVALLPRLWSSKGLATASRGRPLARVALVGIPFVLVFAYFGGWISVGLASTMDSTLRPGGRTPQVPLAVLADPAILGEPGQPVLVWSLHPQGWQLWLVLEDWQASQMLRTIGYTVPDSRILRLHQAQWACTWLRENPSATRITGPRLGYEELLRQGCPEDVVRPDLWHVVVTPADWWIDTDWESTGGAPDPRIPLPDALFE